jgi:hypothetical protein
MSPRHVRVDGERRLQPSAGVTQVSQGEWNRELAISRSSSATMRTRRDESAMAAAPSAPIRALPAGSSW